MATQYKISTNGVQMERAFSHKTRAITEAEKITAVAESLNGSHTITVDTVKGKCVWSVTVGDMVADTCSARFVKVGSDEPGECGAVCMPGENECAHHLGDAQAMAEFLSDDSLAIVNNKLVTVQGESDIPVLTSADGPIVDDGTPFEESHAAYVAELHTDPEVQRMYALEAEALAAKTAVVGVQQSRPGFGGVATHWHAAGCRDITREMNRWGQKEEHTYPLNVSDVAEILVFEMGDVSSDNATVNTPEWWEAVVSNSNELVRIMPCLALMGGERDGRTLVYCEDWFAFNAPYKGVVTECMYCETVIPDEDVATHLHFRPVWQLLSEGVSVESAIIATHAPNGSSFEKMGMRELTPWSRSNTSEGIESVQALMNMIDASPRMFSLYEMPNQDIVVAWGWDRTGEEFGTVFYVTLPPRNFECYGENGHAVHVGECSQAKGVDGPCCSIEDDGTDAGFVETMVTQEYRLSVTVDGAQIDLGWHEFTVNAAQANDSDVIAALYGERHGSGKPRHGWGSIISVTDVMGD